MTVTLIPVGRGRWAQLVMTFEGRHMPPLVPEVGHIWQLGDKSFRVIEVNP